MTRLIGVGDIVIDELYTFIYSMYHNIRMIILIYV